MSDIALDPGKYVVAVSGGVDSVVLLDMLHKTPEIEIIVAHYDHGIRTDSHKDRELTQRHAVNRGLEFVSHEGKLGSGTSEEVARNARYAFLRNVQKTKNADAIITAHHQDDMLETAIINMIRGTGRKGLSSLADRRDVRRPLLHLRKTDLYDYANQHNLEWREDHTNADTDIFRNYIRHVLLPKLGQSTQDELLQYIRHIQVTNRAIDNTLLLMLHIQPSRNEIDRRWFIDLPHSVAKEFMASWLRSHGIRSFDIKTIERLVTASKVLPSGKRIDIDATHQLVVGVKILALTLRDR